MKPIRPNPPYITEYTARLIRLSELNQVPAVAINATIKIKKAIPSR